MRRSILTASTAVLLVSSGALFAQDAQQSGQSFENVFVNVDGSAVQVPVDLAAQACALDTVSVQQMAQTRLDEAGVTGSSIPGLMTADAGSAAGLDASGGMSDVEASPLATAEAGGTEASSMGADMSTADASTVGATDSAAAGTEGSTMTADASSDLASANQPAEVDDAGVMSAANSPADSSSTDGYGSVDTATADASGAANAATGVEGVSGVESTAADTMVTNAQGTADPSTSQPGDQYLALSVCEIDVTRASELGIPNITNETVTD